MRRDKKLVCGMRSPARAERRGARSDEHSGRIPRILARVRRVPSAQGQGALGGSWCRESRWGGHTSTTNSVTGPQVNRFVGFGRMLLWPSGTRKMDVSVAEDGPASSLLRFLVAMALAPPDLPMR